MSVRKRFEPIMHPKIVFSRSTMSAPGSSTFVPAGTTPIMTIVPPLRVIRTASEFGRAGQSLIGSSPDEQPSARLKLSGGDREVRGAVTIGLPATKLLRRGFEEDHEVDVRCNQTHEGGDRGIVGAGE